ncbi:histone H2A-beta, sperm-like [Pogoniulus pusillus]|uniref:histone H2A-beta, sperm-like n=1 Tax=Pogoniulus pusillus TaxID=488313 RepID=UPI0030B969EE
MSSMLAAEEVVTVPVEDREPELADAGSPPESSEARGKRSRSSRSSRAGLLFPVSRVAGQLRRGRFAGRLAARAPVYLAAVLQCVTHKALDVAGRIAKRSRQQRIAPAHLHMAAQRSSQLHKLLQADVLGGRGGAAAKRRPAASRKKAASTKRRCPGHRAAPARARAAAK